MLLSQLLTSQVLTCTVNGCKSNSRRFLVYLIFFVARLDNKWWVVQNSSPEINTRIQKNRASSMPATFSNFTPVSGVIMIFARPWLPNPAAKKTVPLCTTWMWKKSNCWSWKNVDHSKVHFLRSKSQGKPWPPTIPSPQVKLCFTFLGCYTCFSRADVQGFMTSAEKMEIPLASKYGKAGHGLHLNTAGDVFKTPWWMLVVRLGGWCLGWLVVRVVRCLGWLVVRVVRCLGWLVVRVGGWCLGWLVIRVVRCWLVVGGKSG